MRQEVFKTNVFMAIILPIAMLVSFSIYLFRIYLIAGSLPLWMFLFFIIPVGFAVIGQRTKLIIEDDTLRYQHGFITANDDEVSLNQVYGIVTRTIVTWSENDDGGQDRTTKKVTYVLDETGRTYFSFPARLISGRNRQRFAEAVAVINPNITLE